MSQVLSLPAIDTEGITLLNQLFRISHHLFSSGLLPAQLIPVFSTAPAPKAKTRLELRWDNLPIYLYLDSSLAALAASLLPSNANLSSLSEDITLALFEKAFLANYDTLLDIPLSLQKIEDVTQIPEYCYTLQWQPGHPILRGQLCIEHHIAPALIDKLTRLLVPELPTQKHAPSALFSTLPIPVRMEIGTLNLSLREIKALEKYDLLLPQKSYFTKGIMQLQLSASLGFTVTLKDNTCTVITPLESYRTHMDNNENDFDDDFKKFLEDIPETSYEIDASLEASDDNLDEVDEIQTATTATRHQEETSYPGNLDDVDIRLTFDVGSLQLTLGELANITPGYTFNLAKSIHKAVTIRANGTIIGKGELVDIEGTIGVSIVELHQRGKG